MYVPRGFQTVTVLLTLLNCAGGMIAPVCAEALQWAQVVSIHLANRGVPAHLEHTDQSNIMLHACVEILDSELAFIPRELHFVEMFSGAGGISKILRTRDDVRVHSYDRKDHPHQDACKLIGMAYGLWLTAAVVLNGVIFFSPQCSTWITMTRNSSLRSRLDVLGDTDRQDVMDANHVALFVSGREGNIPLPILA